MANCKMITMTSHAWCFACHAHGGRTTLYKLADRHICKACRHNLRKGLKVRVADTNGYLFVDKDGMVDYKDDSLDVSKLPVLEEDNVDAN